MESFKKRLAVRVLVWAVLFGVCSLPVMVIAPFFGVFTSYNELAAGWMAKVICPADTEGKLRTYATTTRDDYGNDVPATGYELICVNASGEVVKTDPVLYSFLWIGLVIALGVVVAAVFSLFGTLIFGWIKNRADRAKDPYRQNIEPR
ncbi:MAG: hypothetical protein N3D16_07455 [Anaerolineales bacterium]|nr:hypothetical protein [Anaerolineales bacterium]